MLKAGKSSVLEALSGIQLPRGQNICTRCPLELRMKHAKNEEYAIIRCDGVDKLKLSNFAEISSQVIEFTNKLAGTNMGVSSSPIYLTVYKKDIQEDLTLIDLPGMLQGRFGVSTHKDTFFIYFIQALHEIRSVISQKIFMKK